jgi:hypothetical protein
MCRPDRTSAPAAERRVGFAQEAAQFMQPVCAAAHFITRDEFDRIPIAVSIAIWMIR